MDKMYLLVWFIYIQSMPRGYNKERTSVHHFPKYKEKASRFSAGMNLTPPAQALIGVGNGYF